MTKRPRKLRQRSTNRLALNRTLRAIITRRPAASKNRFRTHLSLGTAVKPLFTPDLCEVSFPDRRPRPGSALTWVEQLCSGFPSPRRTNSGSRRSALRALGKVHKPGAKFVPADSRLIAGSGRSVDRPVVWRRFHGHPPVRGLNGKECFGSGAHSMKGIYENQAFYWSEVSLRGLVSALALSVRRHTRPTGGS